MIRVKTSDPGFHEAYWRACRALPVITLESPRQYGARWREAYRCRVDATANTVVGETVYIFDRDEDYTWFMLRWG
jgi:hypothetical protein